MEFKGFRDWNLLPALLGDTSKGQFQLLDIMSKSEKKTITIKKKYLSGRFTFTVRYCPSTNCKHKKPPQYFTSQGGFSILISFQLLDIMSRSEKKTITIKKKYLSGYFTLTVSTLDQEPAYFFPSMVL